MEETSPVSQLGAEGVFCSCGNRKARRESMQCDPCARLARKKARPLCACGCRKNVARASGYTYASNQCQKDHEYRTWVVRWQAGLEAGKHGLTVSSHIRRYLIETRGERCERCGWAERNLHTGNIPLTVDHTDGDWEHNHEGNLKLLCPNCHSLTPTFAGANRGKGRKARGAVRYELSQDRRLTD